MTWGRHGGFTVVTLTYESGQFWHDARTAAEYVLHQSKQVSLQQQTQLGPQIT
jgi:hypothetical protein